MKKILLMLLVLAMVLGVMTACQNDKKDETTTETSTAAVTDGTTGNEKTVVPLRSLPDKEYNSEIIFLMRSGKEDSADIFVDESSSDTIDMLVFDRNEAVQDKYKVEFTLEKSAGQYGEAETVDILAGTRYDVVAPHGRAAATYAQKDCCVDLYNLPYLNLTYKWWSQDLVTNFTVNGKLYYATGSLSHYGTIASYCMIYNRDTIADIDGAITPYQYVKQNNWNWSTFSTLAIQSVRDMDGDGFSTLAGNGDIMGWATYPWGGTYCTFFASNNRILKTDADGMPYFAIATESAYNAMVDYFDLLGRDGFLLEDADGNATIEQATRDGRITFRDTTIKAIVSDFKNVDTFNYGIVPFPKVDTTMDHYTSHVAGYYNMFLVPYTCGNFEATAVVLEALAQEGDQTVIPEYYDYATLRGSRDEENYEMIQIVDQSRFYDFGYFWSPFSTLSSYFQSLALKHSANEFYSMYQALQDAGTVDKKLNDFLILFS